MKLLLLNPGRQGKISSEVPLSVSSSTDSYPPLGLLALQSYIHAKSRHIVVVNDAGSTGDSGLLKLIDSFKPDCIGVTVYTHFLVPVFRLLSFLRIHTRVPLLVGGPHISAFPKSIINSGLADMECYGEGETPLLDYLNCIENRKSHATVPGFIHKSSVKFPSPAYESNFSHLPWPEPEHSLTGHILSGSRAAAIQTSRGCPFKCSFCSTPRAPFRRHSPDHVAEHLAKLYKSGFRHVEILDDIFNHDHEYMNRFCEILLSMKTRPSWAIRGRADMVTKEISHISARAGCVRINLGIETWSDHGLDLLNKGITISDAFRSVYLSRKHGISTVTYLMVGCPHEKNPKDARKLFEFAKGLDPDYALFGVLTPYPNTSLWKMAEDEGIADHKGWNRFIAHPKEGFRPSPWTKYMDRGTLYRLCREGYRGFYYRPSTAGRMLLDGKVMKKAFSGLRLLKRGK